jgi:serine/threonine-protein kinase
MSKSREGEEELMIGQTLGHYKVEEQLGAGGMGVVYRATDSKLGRQVAIKVLPESFAKDPERLARFEREARMLAALNHPNIAAIHGLEESEGTHYLVLELVPGKTLEGPLLLDEAVRVCAQIAEALEAAHEKGIVHRDLKPANVKVTPEGKVKVLDFGLAKPFAPSESDATVSVEASREGTIVGTGSYMSPEQARGAAVDKRTDIWAFGCVVYEVLSGQRAFPGNTISDCLAAVLAKEPAWEAPPEALAAKAPPACSRTSVYVAACLVAGVAAGGLLAAALWRKPPATPAVVRFSIDLPPNAVVASGGNSVAVSPDGTRMAFVGADGGRTQVYLRDVAGLEAKPVPGTAGGLAPFFLPDGQWVAFRSVAGGRTLKKVALSGGAPVTISDLEVFSGAHPIRKRFTWRLSAAAFLATRETGGGVAAFPGPSPSGANCAVAV